MEYLQMSVIALIVTQVAADWSPWELWSDCSATCGDGVRVRKRVCDLETGRDAHNDTECDGHAHNEEPCHMTICPNNKADKTKKSEIEFELEESETEGEELPEECQEYEGQQLDGSDVERCDDYNEERIQDEMSMDEGEQMNDNGNGQYSGGDEQVNAEEETTTKQERKYSFEGDESGPGEKDDLDGHEGENYDKGEEDNNEPGEKDDDYKEEQKEESNGNRRDSDSNKRRDSHEKVNRKESAGSNNEQEIEDDDIGSGGEEGEDEREDDDENDEEQKTRRKRRKQHEDEEEVEEDDKEEEDKRLKKKKRKKKKKKKKRKYRDGAKDEAQITKTRSKETESSLVESETNGASLICKEDADVCMKQTLSLTTPGVKLEPKSERRLSSEDDISGLVNKSSSSSFKQKSSSTDWSLSSTNNDRSSRVTYSSSLTSGSLSDIESYTTDSSSGSGDFSTSGASASTGEETDIEDFSSKEEEPASHIVTEDKNVHSVLHETDINQSMELKLKSEYVSGREDFQREPQQVEEHLLLPDYQENESEEVDTEASFSLTIPGQDVIQEEHHEEIEDTFIISQPPEGEQDDQRDESVTISHKHDSH